MECSFLYKFPACRFRPASGNIGCIIHFSEDNDQILFRYVNAHGDATPEANINGSVDHIAGITNKQKNVLGMMPHPERAMEQLLGKEDGKQIFESILQALAIS